MQPVPAHAAAREIGVPSRSPGDASAPAHAGGAANLPAGEDSPVSGINVARVIQTMGETEMHVGMHSADFGDISIRTSVSQQQMVAQIAVDHGDLAGALSRHIPAAEAKLGGDFGLRASILVHQSGGSFSGGQGSSAQGDPGPYSRSAPSQNVVSRTMEAESPVGPLPAVRGEGNRLDIRA